MNGWRMNDIDIRYLERNQSIIIDIDTKEPRAKEK